MQAHSPLVLQDECTFGAASQQNKVARELVERSSVDALFNDPLHPYPQALLRSIPKFGHSRDKCFGPTKPSLHSGLDQFSIYPLVQQARRGLIHLKTAGTSTLEALQGNACLELARFREILCLARQCYDEGRASYHGSAQRSQGPAPEELRVEDLPALLDDRMARQVLHITFGSVLDDLGPQLVTAFRLHAEPVRQALAGHFGCHLKPFLENYN